jgi:hypothetical protein
MKLFADTDAACRLDHRLELGDHAERHADELRGPGACSRRPLGHANRTVMRDLVSLPTCVTSSRQVVTGPHHTSATGSLEPSVHDGILDRSERERVTF